MLVCKHIYKQVNINRFLYACRGSKHPVFNSVGAPQAQLDHPSGPQSSGHGCTENPLKMELKVPEGEHVSGLSTVIGFNKRIFCAPQCLQDGVGDEKHPARVYK
jgi:hypothetical protein